MTGRRLAGGGVTGVGVTGRQGVSGGERGYVSSHKKFKGSSCSAGIDGRTSLYGTSVQRLPNTPSLHDTNNVDAPQDEDEDCNNNVPRISSSYSPHTPSSTKFGECLLGSSMKDDSKLLFWLST